MTGLYLSRLELSHFRSHKHATLEADGRPVVIFGANGAGKTNILEAISLTSPGRGLRRAKAEELARRPEALGWKFKGTLHSLDQTHEIETSADAAGKRAVVLNDKPVTQTALGQVVRMVWLIPSMDRLWLEGAEVRRRFLDRLTLAFEPLHAEFSVTYEKSMRERNRLLKDMVRDPAWYTALEDRMAQAAVEIAAARARTVVRLQTSMETADTLFPRAILSVEDPGDTPNLQEIDSLRAAFAEGRPTDMRAGRTLIGPHRSDFQAIYAAKNVPARQCSTGEQKALLLAIVLASARALSADFGSPPLMLLDEVAAHLDADRRAALYDEICALDAQAWMTGTGAELFEELGQRAQRFEVQEVDGISQIDQL
ncbi:MAG: DNA replication/repair protein RecF [Pseudomonadota bacterium]